MIALQEQIAAEINAALDRARRSRCWSKGRRAAREGWLAGKTPQFKTAVLPAGDARPGDLVRARVTDATAHTLHRRVRLAVG